MAKNTAEQSNALSIFWLKKHDYIPKGGGISGGGITWTYGLAENKSSIGFTVRIDMDDEPDYIRFNYTHTSNWTGEKESMDYKVQLTTTPCNYGGVRYWFVCPLSRNDVYCGRRVGVIYSIGKWFGCRHCGDIAYAAQMKGGKFRGSSVSLPDIERAEKEVKRYYYNGKPTRKYRRLLKMEERFSRDIMKLGSLLGK